jgi:hypothetical protein
LKVVVSAISAAFTGNIVGLLNLGKLQAISALGPMAALFGKPINSTTLTTWANTSTTTPASRTGVLAVGPFWKPNDIVADTSTVLKKFLTDAKNNSPLCVFGAVGCIAGLKFAADGLDAATKVHTDYAKSTWAGTQISNWLTDVSYLK